MIKQGIELLAPARNAEIGIEAVLHGADAVYIGAKNFGARSAAGNETTDIARLCRFAHTYGARVYVALNTILYDDELQAVEKLTHELYDAGADALIVQDFSLLRLNLPPIALHASTQMDITTPERALFLSQCGFEQIVLARELSLQEIKNISSLVPAKIEAFVHGALCVSYSGRCYASEACFGRSANRGRCAQFCRLSFDILDADGTTIGSDKHFLSLRDMNRSQSLEEMMDAGVNSFKIEGRLKGTDYVKNVTAYYRKAIDDILERRGEYVRTSYGNTTLSFSPVLEKSFNRGFTDYFLHGRTPMMSADTPKAIGEAVGQIVQINPNSFTVKGSIPLHAGDGLCYIGQNGKMEGLRVNRVEGKEVFPAKPARLVVGTDLYRNLDHAFTHALEKPSATRKMQLDIVLRETQEGYSLTLSDEAGKSYTLDVKATHEVARSPQAEAIRRQLSRLGDTPYELRTLHVHTNGERFIPASILGGWRRQAVKALLFSKRTKPDGDTAIRQKHQPAQCPTETVDYTANISNEEARAFLTNCGAKSIAPAFEIQQPEDAILMTCRHCLRYALGACTRYGGTNPTWKEPLSLRLPDGRRFPIEFDCQHCEMRVKGPIE